MVKLPLKPSKMMKAKARGTPEKFLLVMLANALTTFAVSGPPDAGDRQPRSTAMMMPKKLDQETDLEAVLDRLQVKLQLNILVKLARAPARTLQTPDC